MEEKLKIPKSVLEKIDSFVNTHNRLKNSLKIRSLRYDGVSLDASLAGDEDMLFLLICDGEKFSHKTGFPKKEVLEGKIKKFNQEFSEEGIGLTFYSGCCESCYGDSILIKDYSQS